MKKLIGLNMICFIILNSSLLAQGTNTPVQPEIKKPLAEKDRETIIEIFKSVDDGLYLFEFQGVGIYGKRALAPQQLYHLRNGKDIPITKSFVSTYIPSTNFWYVVAQTKSSGTTLEGIFGKANLARLNAIINKYTAANN